VGRNRGGEKGPGRKGGKGGESEMRRGAEEREKSAWAPLLSRNKKKTERVTIGKEKQKEKETGGHTKPLRLSGEK